VPGERRRTLRPVGAFATSRAWTLPSVDGSHTVAAHVRDLVGNVAILTDTILLDTTPPPGHGGFPDALPGGVDFYQQFSF